MIYQGNSGCTITIEDGLLVKRGSKVVVGPMKQAYRQLQEILGTQYLRFFPNVEDYREEGPDGVLVLECAGTRTLEELAIHAKTKAEIREINRLIAKTCQLLKEMTSLTLLERGDATNATIGRIFLNELISLCAATTGLQDLPPVLESHQEALLNGFRRSACHRDLGLHNVVVDDSGRVRFIDPKLRPNQRSAGTAYGSAALDIAKLDINLGRLENLRNSRRRKPAGKVGEVGRDLLKYAVRHYLAEGVFTKVLFLLCQTVVYGRYAACACAFCLAPARKGLFLKMGRLRDQKRRALEQALHRLHITKEECDVG